MHPLDEKRIRSFQRRLLNWFAREGRDLPWRRTRNPYRVWVSEVMLQQTQVDRVIDFYHRFLKRFPTVTKLARAEWEEVLECWRGLGYYGRARNMMKTAQAVAIDHRGRFPRTAEALEELPGIGPYTARSISVFAFEQDHLVLDTNTSRVIGRVFGFCEEKLKLRDALMQHADAFVPKGKAWPFHQGLMDLGATICTAKLPQCECCPMANICTFLEIRDTKPEIRNRKLKTTAKRITCHVSRVTEVAAAVIHREGKILVTNRPRGHLKGYWEFPGGKRERGEDWRHCLKREIREELGIEVAVRPHDWKETYAYPDRTVHTRFHRCSILTGDPTPQEGQRIRWVTPETLTTLRFPPADRTIVKALSQARFVDPHR